MFFKSIVITGGMRCLGLMMCILPYQSRFKNCKQKDSPLLKLIDVLVKYILVQKQHLIPLIPWPSIGLRLI